MSRPSGAADSRNDTVHALVEEASYLTASDPKRARDCLQRALALQPWNAQAHHLLGITESDTQNLAIAAQHLESATDLDPFNCKMWYDLGVVEFRREYVLLAREHFQKALTLRTDYVDALLNLGVCYAETGEDIAATAALSQVITLDPTEKRRVSAIAVVKDLAIKTARPRPRRQRRLLGLLKRKQRDAPLDELSPVQRLIDCRDLANQHPEQAVDAFRELLASLEENTPSYWIATQHLANIFFRMQQYDKSFILSSAAVAGLPCVKSLVVERLPLRLLEAGMDKDAKRVYACLLEDLGVRAGLVALAHETHDGPAPDYRKAIVSCDGGIYEILRGGNIFVITAPDGQVVEHQAYDCSDRVLGIW